MKPSLIIVMVLLLLTPGTIHCETKYFERPAGSHYIFDKGNMLSHTDELLLRERLVNFKDTSGIEFLLITIPSADGISMYSYAAELAGQWERDGEISPATVILVIEASHSRMGIGAASAMKIEFPVSVAHNLRRKFLKPTFVRQDLKLKSLVSATDVIMAIATGNDPDKEYSNSFSMGVFLILVVLFLFFGLFYPLFLYYSFRNSNFSSKPSSFWSIIALRHRFSNSNISGFEEFSTGRGPFAGRTHKEIMDSIKNGGGGATGKW